jgi:hypothetical protein
LEPISWWTLSERNKSESSVEKSNKNQSNRSHQEQSMTLKVPNRPSALIYGLGLAGLIPFVGLAALSWVPEIMSVSFSGRGLASYAAVILSFLGAIYWGLAMSGTPSDSTTDRIWLWGVLPSVLAWLAQLLPEFWALLLLGGLLWVCFIVDRIFYPKYQLQGWLPMRLLLTTVASFSCVVGALGIR